MGMFMIRAIATDISDTSMAIMQTFILGDISFDDDQWQ